MRVLVGAMLAIGVGLLLAALWVSGEPLTIKLALTGIGLVTYSTLTVEYVKDELVEALKLVGTRWRGASGGVFTVERVEPNGTVSGKWDSGDLWTAHPSDLPKMYVEVDVSALDAGAIGACPHCGQPLDRHPADQCDGPPNPWVAEDGPRVGWAVATMWSIFIVAVVVVIVLGGDR